MQTRDFVYVGDVAAANVQAITTRTSNRILNISTQTEISVNKLAFLLSEIAEYNLPIHYRAARQGDILRSMLRNSEACKVLDWQPATSLRDGLRRTYQALNG